LHRITSNRQIERQTDRQTDRHGHTKLLKRQIDTEQNKTNKHNHSVEKYMRASVIICETLVNTTTHKAHNTDSF